MRCVSGDAPKTQLSLRFSDELLERVDVFRRRVMDALPGHEFTRADAIRVLVERGLQEPPGPFETRGSGPRGTA